MVNDDVSCEDAAARGYGAGHVALSGDPFGVCHYCVGDHPELSVQAINFATLHQGLKQKQYLPVLPTDSECILNLNLFAMFSLVLRLPLHHVHLE